MNLEKKRLSVTILENILKTYQKINNNDIKEYEIDFLLEKHRIDSNNYNESNKKSVSEFVKDLKILITDKINGNTYKQNDNILIPPIHQQAIHQIHPPIQNNHIHPHVAHSHVHTQPQQQFQQQLPQQYPQPQQQLPQPQQQLPQQLVQQLPQQNEQVKQVSQDPIVYDKLIEKYFIIAIDSKDRNMEKYPNPNEFSISFGYNDNIFSNENSKKEVGFIHKKLNNIKYVKLVSLVLPYKTNEGDSIDNYPYLLLDIDEIGSKYEGTNRHLDNTFARIILDKKVGKWCTFSGDVNHEFIKYFNPMIEISKFTIRIKKPDGTLFNFGNSINTDIISDTNIDITTDITTDIDTIHKIEIRDNIICEINMIFEICKVEKSIDNNYKPVSL
jgi:hypothetical protein